MSKWFCKHEYFLLATYEEDIDDTVGYKEELMHTVYCPKCKKQKDITQHEYNCLVAREKVDEDYAKRQGDN